MLVVNQQAWTHTLETVITSMTEEPEALKKHWEFSCEELLRTVELVRTDINKNLRTSLGAMVVMDVHNRDTTEELAALQISDIGEFDWLAQLRCAHIGLYAMSVFGLAHHISRGIGRQGWPCESALPAFAEGTVYDMAVTLA